MRSLGQIPAGNEVGLVVIIVMHTFFASSTLKSRQIAKTPVLYVCMNLFIFIYLLILLKKIFNTYGELDNLQLIQRHGFSEPVPTRWEEAMISLSLIKSLTGMGDARESIIKELVCSCLHRYYFDSLPHAGTFLGWCLRYLVYNTVY